MPRIVADYLWGLEFGTVQSSNGKLTDEVLDHQVLQHLYLKLPATCSRGQIRLHPAMLKIKGAECNSTASNKYRLNPNLSTCQSGFWREFLKGNYDEGE